MIKRPISKGDSERKAPVSRRQRMKTNDNSFLPGRGLTKKNDVRTYPKLRKNTSKTGSEDYSAQGIRINKYLADAGLGSRRRVEELIIEGVVKVNRKAATDLSVRIMPGDFVTVMGEPVSDRKVFTYILLNKPKDIITTVSDELGRATVMDIVRKEVRIYPVGRLDRNTTGALILTNDGELAYRLTHPKYEVPRVYNVVLDAPLDLRDAASISRGIELEDGITGECEVLVNPEDRRKVALGIREGRNREVRRIFESLGYEVQRLDRKSFATLTTRGLARGEYRNLTQKEILELKKLVGLHTKYETSRKRKSRHE
ncbi:hypothetical protein MASR2M18_10280 [Ignavibacteria bacterium]|nr:rRNA pseudouridine synthase [Bacteroidota bacterium]MCZ2133228.1 rRNA pseudouridine synthase [Bacteroidota bacterium]